MAPALHSIFRARKIIEANLLLKVIKRSEGRGNILNALLFSFFSFSGEAALFRVFFVNWEEANYNAPNNGNAF